MRGRSLFPFRVIFEHLVLFLFYILLFYRSKKKELNQSMKSIKDIGLSPINDLTHANKLLKNKTFSLWTSNSLFKKDHLFLSPDFSEKGIEQLSKLFSTFFQLRSHINLTKYL